MSDVRDDIRAHFEFYRELGIDGISRDPAWTRRADRPVDGGPTSPADDLPEALRDDFPLAPSGPTPVEALGAIREDLGDCIRCKLHGQGRTQIVYGVGSPTADLMFIGEAPGADEDIQGEPFVGRAGQLLTKIIEAMGFMRKDIYIANVLKCRPPGNRNPEPDEVATCQPFLFRQIEVVQPKVMVALGTFAAQALLNTKDPISRLRGRAWPCRGRLLVPTFHPAFLLRSPDRKRDTWDDMKLVLKILRGEQDS
ncbi:MAG: uracil-DNA glycosylase [Vicinamibacteraceae bacterium]